MEKSVLAEKIRKAAVKIVPESIREDILKDIEVIISEIEDKIAVIAKTFPGTKISIEGQIESKLMQYMRDERITQAVYQRYRRMVGSTCYTYIEFLRQEKKSKDGGIGSPFLQFLEVESRGLLPGTRISFGISSETAVIQGINKECRVILAGKNPRGVKPSTCNIVEGA